MDKFYGRTKELNEIYNILDMKDQKTILIYGRHLIGKSYLIRKALEKYDCKKIIYKCKNISVQATIEQITKLIKIEFNIKYIGFESIDELFEFLFSQNDLILVLEEYENLKERVKDLDSIINKNIKECKSNMKFIISSSHTSFESIINESNHVKLDKVIKVTEQSFNEATLYYNNYSIEDKKLMYSIFGGEPYFNALIDDSKSAIDNIINLVVKENAILECVLENTLNNNIRNLKSAEEVLYAISKGININKEIADACHITSSSMDNTLRKLIEMEVIEKRIQEDINKPLYFIKINLVRFYYRYIKMNIEIRNKINPLDFYNEYIKKYLFNNQIN